MRHFEKKGTQHLFRRLDTRGSTLRIVLGTGGDSQQEASIKTRSATTARGLLDRWARWALDAGYAEITLPPRTRPGVVATLQSPRGPGRIRLDDGTDVQFLESDLTLAQGRRVLVTGVHRVARMRAPYMFGSKWRVKGVRPFPEPAWSAFKARPDPAAGVRARLARQAGKRLLGKWRFDRPLSRDVTCGDLIFAWERGVHRFLLREKTADGFDMVAYENVLTSKFGRQSSPPLWCADYFCAPIPTALRRAIATSFGI